ncbi:hypothetical protein D3C84_1093600 [compost metagenome]
MVCQVRVSFHGQILFSEPSIKPVRNASARSRQRTSSQRRRPAKLTIPTRQPLANRTSTGRSRLFTAPRMKGYSPSRTRMKLPEIPGRIMAQMAMAPAQNRLSGSLPHCTGDATVIQ